MPSEISVMQVSYAQTDSVLAHVLGYAIGFSAFSLEAWRVIECNCLILWVSRRVNLRGEFTRSCEQNISDFSNTDPSVRAHMLALSSMGISYKV